jgi:hypothetical protein
MGEKEESLRVLSIPEATDLLGVARAPAYNLIRKGDLPTVHMGRRTGITTKHSGLLIVGLGPFMPAMAAADPLSKLWDLSDGGSWRWGLRPATTTDSFVLPTVTAVSAVLARVYSVHSSLSHCDRRLQRQDVGLFSLAEWRADRPS